MIWHTAFLGGINERIATDNTKSFVQVYKQDPGVPSQLGYAQVLAGSSISEHSASTTFGCSGVQSCATGV